ncbi:MAG: GNAT family N-acetyltransferase [Saprospiraceae bacterium]|nr:GNAT family N-acetyltransferase [Saprospiraceae bacterium]
MASNIHFKQVDSSAHIDQILALQALNHSSVLAADLASQQGFLTVRHDPALLSRMNAAYPSVIAQCGDELAGYCLVMPPSFAVDIPVLAPMFALLETLSWQEEPLSSLRWFVMGQVCVAEAYRGQGVFDGMYAQLRAVCRADFDLVVTEIALRNTRSLRAHERVGFQTMHRYFDPLNGEDWAVVGMAL